jgi:ribosomal protein L15E
MANKPIEPWEKPAPKKRRTTKLTPQSKAKAKANATRAGRKYPNLVDNMNAAKEQQSRQAKRP